MGIQDDLAGHSASKHSSNIQSYQRFKFEVVKLEYGTKNTGKFFIAEFEVLESAKTAEIDPIASEYYKKEIKVEVNPVGSRPAARIKFTGNKNDMGPANTLAFLGALVGEDSDAFWASPKGQSLMVEAVGPEQPYEGYPIAGESYTILTKEKKTPFTIINWIHVPQSIEEKKFLAQAKAERLKAAKIASK